MTCFVSNFYSISHFSITIISTIRSKRLDCVAIFTTRWRSSKLCAVSDSTDWHILLSMEVKCLRSRIICCTEFRSTGWRWTTRRFDSIANIFSVRSSVPLVREQSGPVVERQRGHQWIHRRRIQSRVGGGSGAHVYTFSYWLQTTTTVLVVGGTGSSKREYTPDWPRRGQFPRIIDEAQKNERNRWNFWLRKNRKNKGQSERPNDTSSPHWS